MPGVWYLSFRNKKITFQKYPSQETKGEAKKKTEKTPKSKKKKAALLLMFWPLIFTFLSPLVSAGYVIVQDGQLNATDTATFGKNVNITGNITLGDKITFALGELIDNIVDGWLRITGNLNVTESIIAEKNITAEYFIGSGKYLTDVSGEVSGKVNSTAWNRSGTNVFLANTGDSVGIGTTSPGKALDVVGAIRITESDSENPALYFEDTNSANYYRYIYDSGANLVITDTETGGGIKIETPNDAAGSFTVEAADGETAIKWDDSSNYLRLMEDGGNVGIGTTGPSEKLHVYGTGNTRALINSDASGSASLGLKVGTNNPAYIYSHMTGNSDLRFTTDGFNDRMVITNTGNVGIGTTEPDGILEVQKTDGTAHVKISTENSAYSPELYLANYNGQDAYIGFASTGGKLHISEFGGTRYDRMTIDQNGKVGIGTTEPGYKLHVNSGTTDEIAKFYSSDTDARILIEDSSDVLYIGTESNKGYFGFTNGLHSNNFVVTNTGNVGIGTTSCKLIQVLGTLT
ncbi:MAG: hypothetical protein JRJ66_02760 [Deltaproteobacteria bacterium]|nr:hypothetical protein [Deltaproteobacteria bacterium]